MIKEFEIKDILNAVKTIAQKEGKRTKKVEMKIDSADKDDVLSLNKQVRSNKSDVLVLNQMIE